jgi:hypothetical protein
LQHNDCGRATQARGWTWRGPLRWCA